MATPPWSGCSVCHFMRHQEAAHSCEEGLAGGTAVAGRVESESHSEDCPQVGVPSTHERCKGWAPALTLGLISIRAQRKG